MCDSSDPLGCPTSKFKCKDSKLYRHKSTKIVKLAMKIIRSINNQVKGRPKLIIFDSSVQPSKIVTIQSKSLQRKINPIVYFTLIGMRGDTFISLWLLDQILSVNLLSKMPNFLGGENWHQSGWLIWHSAKCYENVPS